MPQDYPRMMFHRSKDPVIIHSESEEAALGAEWQRTVFTAALPPEEKPVKRIFPEPDPDPEEEPEEEEPDPEDPAEIEPPENTQTAPAAKPKRGRPPAPKSSHKTTARKRG